MTDTTMTLDVLNLRTVKTRIVLIIALVQFVRITTIGEIDLRHEENRYLRNEKFTADSVDREGLSEDVSLVMIIVGRISHGEENSIPHPFVQSDRK
jgi:hypothetical protein